MSLEPARGLKIQVVGRGRMGAALDDALRSRAAGSGAAGIAVAGVHAAEMIPVGGRGSDGALADVVLLAVPDAEIADAAACIAPGRLVGHLSGMTTLDALHPHEAFSLHPLLSVTGQGTSFAGAYAAIDGSSERALQTARDLAAQLGMTPFRVADSDRAAYHAAASIASNYLVTLEGVAEQLAQTAGVPRAALVPLVEASLRNWAVNGAQSALTGPVVRGDNATVQAQRDAVAERLPEQLELFDALTEATHKLAGGQR